MEELSEWFGVPVIVHPLVPEDKMFVIHHGYSDSLSFHGSHRVRGKKSKRPHGRTSGPKVKRYRKYFYAPAWDKLKATVIDL